ncbi:MAG: putative bifunctional diguanylate cyclase/phosphodiesterase [Usitatibacter sp.]
MMRFVRGLVHARVAHRLFVLFVLSAFLPLAAIGVLSFLQVRGALLQQGEQRLTALAKSYGMTLFERLTLAAEIGTTTAINRPRVVAGDSLVSRTFRSLSVVASNGDATAIIGPREAVTLTTEVRNRISDGKPAVLLIGEGPKTRVILVTAASPAAADVVVGEVKPDFLWGPEDEWPAATEFCVVEEDSLRVLHCPAGMNGAALRAVESRIGATTAWVREDDGVALRARTWSQFLRAGFGTPDWIVIASQPESYHLARSAEFARLYVPVVVLALLLVTWLTIRQSRSIVEPVTQLAERARGIEASDFRSRLNMRRDDEFGQLGAAFDQMSARLGRQFASLTALSEVDRLILSTQDTVQVIRIVLQRLDNVIANDFATITIFDQDNHQQARTYFRPREAPDSVSMVRQALGDADMAALQAISPGRKIELGHLESMPTYLLPMRGEGMEYAYIHPIAWRGELCGILVLGYRAEASHSEEESQSARELADRMAVAVSSAWRDEQLYAQAHFDLLTGLPNRLLFEDRLEREIARGQREGKRFAVLFVDLDHFKNVNDSLGHNKGDDVLREAARRVSACVRDSDTVARLGGDEFTVLITTLHSPQDAWAIAEAVVTSLSREFTLGEQSCFLSASVGIASYPADGQSVEQLLKSADTAMYRAKANGRSQAVFFEERMNAETISRLTLDRDLRVAMERGELVLHYQPKLDLRSGAICGAEALIRWRHPTHGLISPARFIPLAEETGFIEQIGQWILEQACAQMRAWQIEGLPLDHIAVNVSPRQFRKRSLVDFIRRCVSEASLEPSALEIEITEGLLVDRGEAVEGMLHEISAAGHKIALDDFGTGFSSMAYLKRFPVDTIKIDRVFIDGLERSADSEAIVAAIIAMSHALGKVVIAEGVETEEQLALLMAMRCDEIQGFILSPAVAPVDFAELVRARARGTVAA